MATSPGSSTPAAEVYDLIAAFAEAADARLRGNAAHALSVLASRTDGEVSERARDDLLRVLSAEPGGIGMDWQRRFAPRALDAVRQLPESHRGWIRDGLLKVTTSSTTEMTQRQAAARLALTAAAPGQGLWSLNWLQYFRLTRLAGRPGFWSTLWAAGWRSAVTWYLLLALAPAALFAKLRDNASQLGGSVSEPLALGAVGLAVLSCFSLPGRLRPSRNVWLGDVAICAAVFGILGTLGTWIFAPTESISALTFAAILGVVIGAATRALRWSGAWFRIEHDDTARILRPLAALMLATAVCMIVTALGATAQTVSAVWIVLAPAALVATLLDLWLEDNGPQPLTAGTPRLDRRWAIPLAAALGSVAVVPFGIYNVMRHGELAEVPAVRLPEALAAKEQAEISIRLNRRVPFVVEEDGWYRIEAVRSGRTEDTVLYIYQKSGVLEERRDDPDPPTVNLFLKRGEFTACVAILGDDKCALPSTVPSVERPQPPHAKSARAELVKTVQAWPVESAMGVGNFVLTGEPRDPDRVLDRYLIITMGPKDEELPAFDSKKGTIRAGSVVRVKRSGADRHPKWTDSMDQFAQHNLVVKRIFQTGPMKEIVFEDQESGLRWNTAWIIEIVPGAPEDPDAKK